MSNQLTKTIKILSLVFLGSLFNFLAFHSLIRLFVLERASSFVSFIVFTILFFSIVLLQSALLKKGGGIITLLFIQGLVPMLALIPYLPEPPYFILLSSIVMSIFIAISVWLGMGRYENSLRIRFLSFNYRTLTSIATGFIIMIVAVSYVYFIQFDNLSDEKMESVFEVVLDVTDPILNTFFPGVSFDQSIDDMLREVEERILIEEQRELFLEESSTDEIEEVDIESVVDDIEAFLGSIDRSIPLSNVILNMFTNEADELSEGARNLLSILIIIPLFFLLKLMFWVIYPFVILIAVSLYKIMLLTGFAYIKHIPENKEVIELF